MYLTSSVLSVVPGVIHGFGTLEESLPLPFSKQWQASGPKHRQNHGSNIACVKTPSQECGEVDGLFTRSEEIPIGIVTADCVPILLAHRLGNGVAAVHAGWRGTRAHILRQLWNQLMSEGENPKEWVAAVGPAIGPCCYEVSTELAEDFQSEFKYLGDGLAVPSVTQDRNLDLPAINAAELKAIGLYEVDLIRACTHCSQSPRFHSYRREGSGTRQWSVIQRI